MKKINYLKYGLTALMMAFAMTLCYSCSSEISGHAYVELAGLKWATENVGAVKGVEAVVTDPTYGCYYTQSNAKKAAESWGGTWTLPTKAEWQALIKNCDWTQTTQDNKECYKVSDKKDSSKFIILPADGIYYEGDSIVRLQGRRGYYWSTDNGRGLYFLDGPQRVDYFNKNNGMVVRPVTK